MPRICVVKDSHETDEEFGVKSARREFDLIGYATQADAETAVLSHAQGSLTHDVFPTLMRKSLSVDEFQSNPEEWSVTVTWERWVPDVIGDEILSGSVGVQTVKVTYAYNHIGDYAPSGQTPIKSYGALGLKMSEDGIFVAEGQDVEFPVLTFTIEKTYAKGYGNIARAVVLHDYAGKPNSISWRGFGPQTVKLTGANISDHDDDEDIVSYSFSASPTVTNLTIPTPKGNIVVPQKLGWQLLSITSIPYPQNGSGESQLTVEAPHTAHIDELTALVDLNDILP